jgi:hypothetical protein
MQALTSSNSNESGRILTPDRTLRANPSLNQVASERIGKTAAGGKSFGRNTGEFADGSLSQGQPIGGANCCAEPAQMHAGEQNETN